MKLKLKQVWLREEVAARKIPGIPGESGVIDSEHVRLAYDTDTKQVLVKITATGRTFAVPDSSYLYFELAQEEHKDEKAAKVDKPR